MNFANRIYILEFKSDCSFLLYYWLAIEIVNNVYVGTTQVLLKILIQIHKFDRMFRLQFSNLP